MLKNLELLNFQKHEKLEISFSSKINVIYGATDEGKSCVRRALSWIFFNTPKGDVVRKTNTKKTSAKITLNNGIQVERIKSATVNAYILYINGEEKRFDSIGKDIPEEVQKVLKMTPIIVDNDKLILNIADQIALPFLLDKSATFRSKLFNQLTGADIVDKALQSLNKDILRVNRESRTEKESVEEKKKQLEELTKEKEEVEKIHNKASEIYKGLKEKEEKYEKLKEYLKKLDDIRKEIKIADISLKEIKVIDENVFIKLNDKINKLNNYSQLLDNLTNNKIELETANKEEKRFKIPEVNIQDLKRRADKLNKLNELKGKLQDIQKLREKIIKEIIEAKTLITNGQIEYKEVLKRYGKCPLCKGEITEECLRRIEL